jgi:hypothetical protein
VKREMTLTAARSTTEMLLSEMVLPFKGNEDAPAVASVGSWLCAEQLAFTAMGQSSAVQMAWSWAPV